MTAARNPGYNPLMRRPLVVVLALLVILGGASFALWWVAVSRLEAGLADFAAQARAQGWTVTVAATQGAGWPLAAELVLTDMTVTAGADVLPGGAVWRAQRAVLHVSPLAPEVLELRVPGVQHLRLFGSEAAHFAAARFTLSTQLRQPGALTLDAADLRFAPPWEGMKVGLLTAHADPSGSFGVTTEAIALPPAPPPALGPHIASATLQGTLRGALPPLSPAPAERAAAWQREGGRVELAQLAVGWGPLGVTGNATLSLDSALQPAGTATLRVVGYDEALAALTAGGVVSGHAAQAIGAVLGLMAQAPEGGGAPQVALPVALDGGALTVGRIPVGRVPKLVWSSAP